MKFNQLTYGYLKKTTHASLSSRASHHRIRRRVPRCRRSRRAAHSRGRRPRPRPLAGGPRPMERPRREAFWRLPRALASDRARSSGFSGRERRAEHAFLFGRRRPLWHRIFYSVCRAHFLDGIHRARNDRATGSSDSPRTCRTDLRPLRKFWGFFSMGDLVLGNFLTLITEFIGVRAGLGFFGIRPAIAVGGCACDRGRRDHDRPLLDVGTHHDGPGHLQRPFYSRGHPGASGLARCGPCAADLEASPDGTPDTKFWY